MLFLQPLQIYEGSLNSAEVVGWILFPNLFKSTDVFGSKTNNPCSSTEYLYKSLRV